ncbi:MAG: amino acid permease [Patescibacteria group bacterium]
MPKEKTGSNQFNAFKGVFVPTFLSIVGVILFLRLGYIVGGAGLLGSVLIILLSVSVTLSTGLSLSSIASNVRIGAGGAYSIINKTLGLEIGGSIGIPLYLAQAFSVAVYIFGFAETWQLVFPEYEIRIVALVAFALLFLLTFVSTKLAVKVQTYVAGIIVLALALIYAGGSFSGDFVKVSFQVAERLDFWTLFAIFFPAVTGLMAGIGMSGELSDPKRQIPKGILWGLGVSTVIYLSMAVLLAFNFSPEELMTNTFALVDASLFPQLVIGGILAATLSSALTVMIAAPRVMEALAQSGVLPGSKFLASKEDEEEPRNAVILTGIILLPLILGGSLDSVAQVLTMFFLITYVTINLSVFLEQFLGLRSFRPIFKVPMIVPMYGALASLVIMFLINVWASIVAIVFIFFIYGLLANKSLPQQKGDVRSGVFRAFSEWAAEKTRHLPESSLHIWKPNMVIPVLSTRTIIGNFPLIKSIAYPNGRMTVLGFKLSKNLKDNPEEKDITEEELSREIKQLPELVEKFNGEKIFTSYSTIQANDYINSLIVSIEAIQSQVFAPNVLFLPYKPSKLRPSDLQKIINSSVRNQYGLALFDRDEDIGLGTEEDIHVWITSRVLKEDMFTTRHYDLAMLTAYSIEQNWDGKVTLWMCVDQEDDKKLAEKYLHKLIYEARLPHNTKVNVVTGDFHNTLKNAPQGDIHIFPFEEHDIDSIYKIAEMERKSNLFILDSRKESILA